MKMAFRIGFLVSSACLTLACAGISPLGGERDTASLGAGNGSPGGQAIETIQVSSTCGVYYPFRNRFFQGYIEDRPDARRMHFPSDVRSYTALIPGRSYAQVPGAGDALFMNVDLGEQTRRVDRCIPKPVGNDPELGDSPMECLETQELPAIRGVNLLRERNPVCVCVFGTLVQSQVGQVRGRWVFEHVDAFVKRPMSDCANFVDPVALRREWVQKRHQKTENAGRRIRRSSPLRSR